ncbi:MAG: virulence sensor protein BvgS [Cyanobacteriota bacterium]|jgi:methyl-accepting chemotaxis protein
MVVSAAIAAIIAWRTSRAIAEPVAIVTQIAEQVAKKSNFDLRAPINSDDEIGSSVGVRSQDLRIKAF